MQRCKIISNVFEHGTAYGKKGDEVVVPDHIATAFSKGRQAKLEVLGPVESTEEESAVKPVKKAK